MRVLYVYKDYYPVRGGIEHHVQLLAEGLSQRGVEVRVLVTNTGRSTVQEMINGVEVTKTGRLIQISSAPISLSMYPHLARLGREADITHLHFPYPPAEVGQLFVGRGRPFVLTYHSDIVRQKVLGFLYRPFLGQVLRKASLITLSNPAYIRLSRFLQPFSDKCRVIPHGADLTRFEQTSFVRERAPEIRQEYGTRPLVLFVGRLRHYKGLGFLIAALQEVDAQLIAVGTGPMGPQWKQEAVERGVAERVSFLGEVSEEELISLYHAADVFVLPSTNRAETWGTVQIEAMACGLPLICTELGTGTSYVNQHGVTGLVVPPSDSSALARALQQILGDDSLRRRMGAAGLQRARSEFSKEAMFDSMLAFYGEALGISS
jgi:rhamnosyl/mannosyltransferase